MKHTLRALLATTIISLCGCASDGSYTAMNTPEESSAVQPAMTAPETTIVTTQQQTMTQPAVPNQ